MEESKIQSLITEQKFNEALNGIKTALDKGKQDKRYLLYLKAYVYNSIKEPVKAILALDEAMTLDVSKAPSIYYKQYLIALEEIKDYKSLEEFALKLKAISIKENDKTNYLISLYNLGRALVNQKNYQEGKKTLNTYLKKGGQKTIQVLMDIGFSFAELDDYMKASELWKEAADLAENNFKSILLTEAAFYSLKGDDNEKAGELIDEAFKYCEKLTGRMSWVKAQSIWRNDGNISIGLAYDQLEYELRNA